MVFDNVLCSCFESWFCLCHCLCPPWLSLGLDFVPLTPHLSSVSHGQWGQRNNLSHSLFCSLLRHVINNTGKRRGGPEIIALPYRAKRRQIYIWFRRKLHFTAIFNVGPSFIFLSQTQGGLLPAYSEAEVSQGGKSHLSKLFESENKVAIPHNGLPQHLTTYSLNFLREEINPKYLTKVKM